MRTYSITISTRAATLSPNKKLYTGIVEAHSIQQARDFAFAEFSKGKFGKLLTRRDLRISVKNKTKLQKPLDKLITM